MGLINQLFTKFTTQEKDIDGMKLTGGYVWGWGYCNVLSATVPHGEKQLALGQAGYVCILCSIYRYSTIKDSCLRYFAIMSKYGTN